MSQNTRESLSALMDGESDELELRRVLKSLPDNADAADTWRRYHLARSVMQREQGVDVSMDLSAGVMARLQEEPAPLADMASETSQGKSHKAPTVSFARGAGVAAAVSLMVITGVQFFSSGFDNGNEIPSADRPNSVANAPSLPANATQQVQPVNLATSEAPRIGVAGGNVPMFEPTPFRLNGQSTNSGLMNVSEGGFSASQLPSNAISTNNVQHSALDVEQVRLLRSYLEQHAHGAAYGNSDSWLPLTRSAMSASSLGQ
jgi:sigma-E factor negative regulatory protein RseA